MGAPARIDKREACPRRALKAIVEVSQRNGGRWIYPTDIMTGPMHPACLNGFTIDEIDQASRFLVRMGVIEPKRAPRKAA